MSNLRPQVRIALESFVASQGENHTATDILRVIQEEATLMKETEDVRDALTSDPYEQFEQIPTKRMERFKRLFQVTVCDRVRCGADYARIHAVVAFPTVNNMALTFLYERQPRRGMPLGENGACSSQVSYTIELSFNHGQRERLLEVQVWAASNVPCTEPAVCIHNELEQEDDDYDDKDGWEDIEEGECGDENAHLQPKNGNRTKHGTAVTACAVSVDSSSNHHADSVSPSGVQAKKKQRTSRKAEDPEEMGQSHENDDDLDNDNENIIENDNRDQYVAFLDPDVMQSFLESAGMLPMHDGIAFFLLMTFPFFEHEWDLVGFVLDQFFGGEGDDGGDDDDE